MYYIGGIYMLEYIEIIFFVCVFVIFMLLILESIKRKNISNTSKKFFYSYEKCMMDLVNKIIRESTNNVKDYKNIEDYVNIVTDRIICTLLGYIRTTVLDLEKSNKISINIVNYILNEKNNANGNTNLEDLVDDFINSNNIDITIRNNFMAESIIQKAEEIIDDDKRLEKLYSDDTMYNEEVDKYTYNYEEPEEETHTQEEIDRLNPPREEDEELYDENDDTVEEIGEE
jgi:hypothetical protein